MFVMGSEHSSHAALRPTSFDADAGRPASGNPPGRQVNLRRQHTIANPGGGGGGGNDVEGDRPGSTSPGPSVCSDIDLPYISYTVNRPIGADSPKISKGKLKAAQAARKTQPIKTTTKKPPPAHNIVVVKAAAVGPHADRDPDVVRLANIPMFLPIMRATLSLPAARDPEVLERLDPVPAQKLCARYQSHMHACATLIATEQQLLAQKVKDVDGDVARMAAWAVERQRHFGKHYDKLRKVGELSHQLNRCHAMLNACLESIETLNDLLDIDDRLEPFVWTTG